MEDDWKVNKLAVTLLIFSCIFSVSTWYFLTDDLRSNRTSSSEIQSLASQISNDQNQISVANQQISALTILENSQSSSNQQLIAQISTLEATISQLRAQIDNLNAEILTDTETLGVQKSIVMANDVILSPSNFVYLGTYVVPFGPINYAGYVRVSWNGPGALFSFVVQVFDINITTPVQVAGVFDIPVAANATNNMILHCYGSPCTVTYSIQYWY